MNKPKTVKDEMWLMLSMGFAGLNPPDYEVDLRPLDGDRVRMLITFSAEKECRQLGSS